MHQFLDPAGSVCWLAVAKTAWATSHIHIEVNDQNEGQIRVRITGNATFLRLPRILGHGDLRSSSRGVTRFGGISGGRGGGAVGVGRTMTA